MVVAALVVSVLVVLYVQKRRADNRAALQRQAAYHAALRSFSETLKPGMSRKDVEDYLRAQNRSFGQYLQKGYAYSDLVKVGEEPKPWFCSEWPVYVEFEFTADHQTQSLSGAVSGIPTPSKSDVLKEIHLTGHGEGCL